jgi:hypothetical protein
MKKNYFGKLLAIAMVFAGFSLTSCDENDNAIIDGKVWVKPEVQLVDGGAIIQGSSTKDINAMLGRVRQEIIQAANNGEKFTIDIQTSVLNSTADDNTLNIAAVTGGDLVLNLPGNIVTDVPLIIQKQGVADDAPSAPSDNNVEINIPSGASNIDLGINMPTSTVTLTGGTIDNLTAVTAFNTLVIESGVSINWLKIKDGRALVKDGGKVNGYLFDGDEQNENGTDVEVNDDGVSPFWGKFYPAVYFMEGETQKAYYTQNIKIVKGKAKFARVGIQNAFAKEQLESLIIDDGAAASISLWDSYDSDKGEWIDAKGVKLVEGLGNRTAKVYSDSRSKTTIGSDIYYGTYFNLQNVNELKNVSVDVTVLYDQWEWDGSENVSLGDLTCTYGQIGLSPSSTDCDFNSPESIYGSINDDVMSKVTNCNLTCPTKSVTEGYYTNPYISTINANNSKLTAQDIRTIDGNSEGNTFKSRYVAFETYYNSGNSATVKNCKFESTEKEDNATIYLPYQTEKRSSFDFIFDTCAFGKGFMFRTDFAGNKPWLDKDGKKVTKGYYWYELEEDGTTIKRDDNGSAIEKQSPDEKDIPEANKANGETWYGNGYWIRENSNGLALQTYYKDYKANIKFNSTTIDGKTITKDTDFISNVDTGYDEKGNPGTTTYFVLDGTSYEALYNANTDKWKLVAVE